MKKNLILSSLLLFSFLFIGARPQQFHLVCGQVKMADPNIPMPGVSVLVLDDNHVVRGTTTNDLGVYCIDMGEGSELMFSFIGCASTTVLVTNQSSIDVVLNCED